MAPLLWSSSWLRRGAVCALCAVLSCSAEQEPQVSSVPNFPGTVPAGTGSGGAGSRAADTGGGAAGDDAVSNPSASGGSSDSTIPGKGAPLGSGDAGGTDAPATGAGGSTTQPSGPGIPGLGVLSILPIGDSITRATCWRARLWQQLEQSFSGRFDLVGTSPSDSGCSPAGYDRDNQGYSSSLITELVAGITNQRTCDPACPTLDDVRAAMASTGPDVVLMHFGTNDVWNQRPVASIESAYSALLGVFREQNPNVVVLVAQIIPMNVTATTCAGCACPSCVTAVPALNARIASWATANSTASSQIIVVDQFTGFDPDVDNRDGVHPNDNGSQKMADRWFAALRTLL